MTNKPRKKRSVIRRVLLLVVSVYLLYSLGDLQVQLINQRKEYNELNEQKKVMEQKISELERLLEDGTEADIIEKAARERLGYVYADEQVFVDISGNWFSGKIEGETQALMQLTVGEIVEGKVTGITNFGVFVDLGENQTGMVHISEVAQTYVNDINEHVKQGDTVKMKVLSVGDDGKVSLSIKRAEEPKRRERKPFTAPKPDNSFVWTERKDESASFEDMMNKFKQVSDDKFSDLKRKNAETRRSRRGTK